MRKEATQNQCWRVFRGKPCLQASPAEEAWWQDREPAPAARQHGALCTPSQKEQDQACQRQAGYHVTELCKCMS